MSEFSSAIGAALSEIEGLVDERPSAMMTAIKLLHAAASEMHTRLEALEQVVRSGVKASADVADMTTPAAPAAPVQTPQAPQEPAALEPPSA